MKYESSKVLFHGKRIDVIQIGDTVKREVVDHPGAAIILPMKDSQTVILIRNVRAAVQETLWEIPAGTLEPNEDPANCADRELIEETGYQAGKISHLCNFFSTPGFCNEMLYLYLAEDLTHIGQNLDENEVIEVHEMPLQDALLMIKSGQIKDAKTICSLLYYNTYLRNP